jgi:hypothetical protein
MISNRPNALVEFPVGQFDFEAFQLRVSLSEMMIDLAALVHRFDTGIKPKQEEQLRAFARKNDLDEADC